MAKMYVVKGYDYWSKSITDLRSRITRDHFPQSSAKFKQTFAKIEIVDKKGTTSVGTLYIMDYFHGLYLINSVGIWVPDKGGKKNARFVRSDGTLGQYADVFLKRWDLKTGRRN